MSDLEQTQLDIAVIGAGIVGLFLAIRCKEKWPNHEIAVFEKERFLGEHTSGRNSGVMHAGIYYPNQSLKHLLCLQGNQDWDQIATDLKIPLRRCGKWIVAQNKAELNRLEEIFLTAKKNEVPDIRWARDSELVQLRNFISTYMAIYSPRTGIVDQSIALSQLKKLAEEKGVIIIQPETVLGIERKGDSYLVKLNGYRARTQLLLNASGLSAIWLRRQLGLQDYRDYFVKGAYMKSTQKAMCSELVYPIPLPGLKGLGTHLTLDMNNNMKFGPNAFDVEEVDYSINENYAQEMRQSISSLFPAIDLNSLHWDYTGIRPKIKNLHNEVEKDFLIQSPLANYWEFLGIESPGFTAAPAIANYFIEKVVR